MENNHYKWDTYTEAQRTRMGRRRKSSVAAGREPRQGWLTKTQHPFAKRLNYRRSNFGCSGTLHIIINNVRKHTVKSTNTSCSSLSTTDAALMQNVRSCVINVMQWGSSHKYTPTLVYVCVCEWVWGGDWPAVCPQELWGRERWWGRWRRSGSPGLTWRDVTQQNNRLEASCPASVKLQANN